MTEQARIEICRLAMQLTIELMRDQHGYMAKLQFAAKLPGEPDPLAIFDAIHAHLSKTLTEQ